MNVPFLSNREAFYLFAGFRDAAGRFIQMTLPLPVRIGTEYLSFPGSDPVESTSEREGSSDGEQ